MIDALIDALIWAGVVVAFMLLVAFAAAIGVLLFLALH